MYPLIIIGVLFGSSFTWVISKYFYDQRRRTYLRETTEQMDQMKLSGEIQDTHYSVTSRGYRSVLEKIEAGDIEGAKQELSDCVAVFYQTQGKRRSELAASGILPGDKPDWIVREL